MKTFDKFFTTVLLLCAAILTANGTSAQSSGLLFNEIAHQDSLQFDAFNSRNLDKLMNNFDSSLELYQDNTGVRNFIQTKQAFGVLFKMNYMLNRKLIPGTMEVYPIKDYGAIETGKHTFSHIENGHLQAFTYKFYANMAKERGYLEGNKRNHIRSLK